MPDMQVGLEIHKIGNLPDMRMETGRAVRVGLSGGRCFDCNLFLGFNLEVDLWQLIFIWKQSFAIIVADLTG